MFIPCGHCHMKHGEQYTKECDDFCDYAKVCLEGRELIKVLKAVLSRHSGSECFYCKHYDACACKTSEDCCYELDLKKVKTSYRIDD